MKIYLIGKESEKFSYTKIKKILKESDSCNDNSSCEQLEAILNSTKWKLVNKINFSPQLTKAIRRILRKIRKA